MVAAQVGQRQPVPPSSCPDVLCPFYQPGPKTGELIIRDRPGALEPVQLAAYQERFTPAGHIIPSKQVAENIYRQSGTKSQMQTALAHP